MKLEHRLLSTVVTHPYLVLGATSLLPIVLTWQWRKRRQWRQRDAKFARLLPLAAIVGGASIVAYSSWRSNDARLQSFLAREKTVNEYYDEHPDRHTLPSAREIPADGLRYIDGEWRVGDGKGEAQTVRFRGVNLPAKTPSLPSNLRNTKHSEQFYALKRNVSFVGRPFSLDEAPHHFRRLSHHWGYNLVRLSTSWEAVMHEGPGILDRSYLKYLQELVSLAGEYGLYVLIDPHQDVWSRFTGGDGAPWWTLDAAGFDTDTVALHETGSAVLHQFWNAIEYGKMPRMTWTNNYWKLGAGTMFTLFFAGDDYAPGITVEDDGGGRISIQRFLQKHYLEFVDAVAEAVKDCPNVIGFGTMNEPSSGFVGIKDIREMSAPVLHGHAMSVFEAMRLGSGESLEVPFYPSHFQYVGRHLLNPHGKSAYKSPDLDIWQRVGVFRIDEETGQRVLLRPNHFALEDGRDIKPFYKSIQRTISRHSPRLGAVAYLEPYFDPLDPYPSAPTDLAPKEQSYGWAPHWYDAITLFLGYYSRWVSFDFEWNIPTIGPSVIDWTFRKNVRRIKHGKTRRQSEGMHVIVGETGVQITDGSDGDYTLALDRTLRAMESSDVDYAIWCYEVANTKVDGDLWNNENLSLLSDGRGRGLAAAVRPWPYQYSSGLRVVSQRFDMIHRTYRLEFEEGTECGDCTAVVHVFFPSCHFQEPVIIVSHGTISYDRDTQNLRWNIHHDGHSARSRYVLQIGEAG